MNLVIITGYYYAWQFFLLKRKIMSIKYLNYTFSETMVPSEKVNEIVGYNSNFTGTLSILSAYFLERCFNHLDFHGWLRDQPNLCVMHQTSISKNSSIDYNTLN